MNHEENCPFDRDALDLRLLRLARFRPVPDDVLCELVTREGLCFWVFDRDEMPEPVGDADVDRRLAAYVCAGCPVADECLELEFRAAGAQTTGVWGGLSESDRRALYATWRWHRDNPANGESGGGP